MPITKSVLRCWNGDTVLNQGKPSIQRASADPYTITKTGDEIIATLVFDCETIPDTAAYARLLKCPLDTPVAELAAAWEAAERPFKPLLQQVVSLAAAWIADDGTLQRIATLGVTEAESVQQFFAIMAEHRPTLVGWNSQGFDVPVLLNRAMVHGVSVKPFLRHGMPYDGYLKRYSDAHHRDIMDIQALFRATTPLKMDEAAALLGLPGKLDTHGSDVLSLYVAGDLAAIHAYCQHDVLTTAWIYARLAVSRGWWEDDQADRFEESLHAFLHQHAGTHWDPFRAQVADLAGMGA